MYHNVMYKMKNRILSVVLAVCLIATGLFPANVSAAQEAGEDDVIYSEYFDSSDSLGEDDLPSGWKTEKTYTNENSTGTGRTIETAKERSYYRIDGTVGNAEYVGRVLTDLELPQTGTIEYDFHLEQACAAKQMQVFFCSNSIAPGKTAIRGRISKDGVVTFFNGSTETKINATIKDAGWVHFKYEYDNIEGTYTAEITDANGTVIGKTDEDFSYKDTGAQVGAFSFEMSEPGIFGLDNVEVKKVEEQEPAGDDSVIYTEDFTDSGSLGENGIPVDWTTNAKIDSTSAETGVREITEGEGRTWYYMEAKGGDPKYVGKVLDNAPAAGTIEYDFKVQTGADIIRLYSYEKSVYTGNLAIRGYIRKDGKIRFYNGGSDTEIGEILYDEWLHFKYEFNNDTKTYTVKITNAADEVLAETAEAFNYNNAAAGQVGAFSFSMDGPSVIGIDEIVIRQIAVEPDPGPSEEDNVFYSEYFNDADLLKDGIPDGWRGVGAIAGTYTEAGTWAIRTEGERTYYYIDAKAGEQNKKYIGKVLSGIPQKGTIEYDLKIDEGADIIRLYSYKTSVNSGDLAIRGYITQAGEVYFYNGPQTAADDTGIQIGSIKDAGWVHFKYEYDNEQKKYTVEVSGTEGRLFGTEGSFDYNTENAEVGAFSFSMDGPSVIGIDDIVVKGTGDEQEPGTETDDTVADVIEGEEETVFYSQHFDDSDQLQTNGIPNGWSSTGAISGTYTEAGTWEIRTEGDRSYYYIDAKDGEQNKKYIGKVLSGLSKTGWIEYDFNLIQACAQKTSYPDIMLSFYPSSINSGNIGISGYITPDGEVYFYNSGNPELIGSIQDAGWVHFKYEYNNNKKTYKVTITDEDGNEIGKTNGVYTYRHESGQVGAFSFSMNEPATIGVDNIEVHGYQTPFAFEPEIEPLEQTGKVILEENTNEYILKNDYCKVIIGKKNAAIKKFYTKEGNEICGANGGGSYLLNYQDSEFEKVNASDKQETALNNGVGTIVKQTDDYVEISIKEVNLTKERPNNTSVLPIDVDFRFVLEKDSPGLYMYAVVDRTDDDADRTFKIEQSRYAIKFDYDRLPYSCVQNGELVKIPSPTDFSDMDHLFDSTYVLNDGSIYTKYNNLSYQYDNILVGAYSDEAGLSLLTPSREWAGGGYSKQDIDVHGAITGSSTVNWHLATSHNGTQPAELELGYKKIYGPIMWYASTDESITSKEEAYENALAQAEKEAAKWPYQWLTDEDYAADTRGSLKGSFAVKNGTINTEVTNDLTPEDSVGWAVLSDTKSKSWTLDNAYYEYYAPIKKDGTFEIDNILPGTYKLNINVNGVMDEYEQDGIVIGASEEKDLGQIVWDDPIYGETLWTIGIPDRTAEEYAYAVPYRYWGSHLLFDKLFPDGVDFTVGEDDYSKDWFFVQMASQTAGHREHYDGAFYYDEESGKVKYDASKAVAMTENDERWKGNKLTEYKIRFDSDDAYQDGAVATLLINVCGNRSGTIKATLNGQSITPETVSLYSDGSVGRSGLVGINQLVKIEFDASLIKTGENVIVLTHDHPAYQEDNVTAWENSDYTIYAGNIYDAIRLDVDTSKKEETPDTEKPGESSETTENTESTETKPSESSETTENTESTETKPSESSETTENTESTETKPSESSETTENTESTETKPSESSETTENTESTETKPSESSETTENTESTETKPSESSETTENTESTETKPGDTSVKMQTTVVLKNKTVIFNKKAVKIGKADVSGSTGSITYAYYTDAACTKKTTRKNSGAAGAGKAPKYAGTYYVVASVAADSDYSAAVSNTAKLTIKKAASKVTLKKLTAKYTGKPVAIKKAAVKGSTGKVTYTYYKDKKCKIKTTKKNAGAKKRGAAPKKAGTYYVKATVKANKNYKAATSKAVKLVIKK